MGVLGCFSFFPFVLLGYRELGGLDKLAAAVGGTGIQTPRRGLDLKGYKEGPLEGTLNLIPI